MFRRYFWKKKDVRVKDHGDSFSQLLKKEGFDYHQDFFVFIDVYHNFTTNLNKINSKARRKK